MNLIKLNKQVFEFPSLIDEFFNEESFFKPVRHQNNFPKANVLNKNKEIELLLEVPGVNKDELKLSVEKDILNVKYEHKDEKVEGVEKYEFKEFYQRSFKRSFRVPEGVNVDKITSSYKNGVLSISLPKEKVDKTIKIIEVT